MGTETTDAIKSRLIELENTVKTIAEIVERNSSASLRQMENFRELFSRNNEILSRIAAQLEKEKKSEVAEERKQDRTLHYLLLVVIILQLIILFKLH